MTRRDRAIAGWSAAHEQYLREAHPEMCKSLRTSGELAEHCRRRGVEAVETAELLELQMTGDCIDRGGIIAYELVEDFERSL